MDDLSKIKGIGKARAEALNDVGIHTYKDIAELSDARVAELDEGLNLRGSIDRDDWRAEAKELMETANQNQESDEADKAKTPAEREKAKEVTEEAERNRAGSVQTPLQPSPGAKDESTTEDSSDLDNLQQNTSSEPFGGATVPTSLQDPEAKAHYGAGAPVPRGAVAAGGKHDGQEPGAPYVPDRPFSPDEDVERALIEAQNDEELAKDKRAQLDEGRNYAEIVGSVEGYGEAVRYEQDGKMFNAQKREVKPSRA